MAEQEMKVQMVRRTWLVRRQMLPSEREVKIVGKRTPYVMEESLIAAPTMVEALRVADEIAADRAARCGGSHPNGCHHPNPMAPIGGS